MVWHFADEWRWWRRRIGLQCLLLLSGPNRHGARRGRRGRCAFSGRFIRRWWSWIDVICVSDSVSTVFMSAFSALVTIGCNHIMVYCSCAKVVMGYATDWAIVSSSSPNKRTCCYRQISVSLQYSRLQKEIVIHPVSLYRPIPYGLGVFGWRLNQALNQMHRICACFKDWIIRSVYIQEVIDRSIVRRYCTIRLCLCKRDLKAMLPLNALAPKRFSKNCISYTRAPFCTKFESQASLEPKKKWQQKCVQPVQ